MSAITGKCVRWYACCLVILTAAQAGGPRHRPYSYQYVHREYHQPDYPYDDPGSKWLCLVLGICGNTVFPFSYGQKIPLRPIYEWSQLEFDYPSQDDRQRDIESENFIPGKPAPIDVDVYYGPNGNNKVFVTLPRFQSGVPIALGIVSDKKLNGNPVIKPYPSWRWHTNPNRCSRDRIVSVYRVQIDECGRLWVLDTGKLLEEQVCPPQILAFDLRTNELLHRYEIPKDQYESRSIFVTPAVDVRDASGKCRDTFVYAADCQTYSLIVYDVRRSQSWRVTDKTMYPYPNFGTFSIQGEQFDLMDGILGMALEPYVAGKDRKLFFHAMSSDTENWVYTSDLRNRTRYLHDPQSSPEIFRTYREKRSSQSAAEAIDANGVAYFGVMSDTALQCWDTESEYGPQNIDTLVQNPNTLQFISGIKVINNRKGQQELWFFSVRFQKIAVGSLDPTETNFRIQATKVDDILAGSKCRGRAAASQAGGGYGLRPHPGQHRQEYKRDLEEPFAYPDY